MKTKKILQFPRQRLGEVELCTLCNYPSPTQRGIRIHHRACHSNSEMADRNWAVFYAFRMEGTPVAELVEIHGLSHATIYRIIQRGLTYPGIYEREN